MLSQSAPALDALALQNILSTPKSDIRVLACEKTAGDDRNPIYSYVVANADGDYVVNRIKLTRTGLASNAYRPASKIFAQDRVYETMYDAVRVMNSQRVGRYTSLSGPPPLSSVMFSLNEFGIEPSPLLDSALNEWIQTQTIAPLRYAVYNPQRNEIEVSFADPSAHNDSPHQQELKEAIGAQLKKLFKHQHAINPDAESGPSGRYSRRDENRRTYNMSLIRLNLEDDSFQSESAKAPSYTFAKVSGKAEMILPSSKRAALTEIKTHLKKAKSDRTKAMRAADQRDRVGAQELQATNSERRKVLKAKIKVLRGQVTSLNKSAKAALTAANKAARTHGLSGLNLPITADILLNAKKLAAAKTDVFGATGKRGQFKPKFTPDHKFGELIGQSIHPMPGNKATAKKASATKTPTKQVRPGAMKKMNPGAKKAVQNLIREREKEKTVAVANAKKEIPGFRKSDLKHMNYSIGKNGSLEIMTKDGETHQFTGKHAKQAGLDLITDMIHEAGGRQYNISSHNPEYGAAKKSTRK